MKREELKSAIFSMTFCIWKNLGDDIIYGAQVMLYCIVQGREVEGRIIMKSVIEEVMAQCLQTTLSAFGYNHFTGYSQ